MPENRRQFVGTPKAGAFLAGGEQRGQPWRAAFVNRFQRIKFRRLAHLFVAEQLGLGGLILGFRYDSRIFGIPQVNQSPLRRSFRLLIH